MAEKWRPSATHSSLQPKRSVVSGGQSYRRRRRRARIAWQKPANSFSFMNLRAEETWAVERRRAEAKGGGGKGSAVAGKPLLSSPLRRFLSPSTGRRTFGWPLFARWNGTIAIEKRRSLASLNGTPLFLFQTRRCRRRRRQRSRPIPTATCTLTLTWLR